MSTFTYDGQMLDVSTVDDVEIQVSDSKVVWVNIDGVCRLRICRIKNSIIIKDERR